MSRHCCAKATCGVTVTDDKFIYFNFFTINRNSCETYIPNGRAYINFNC